MVNACIGAVSTQPKGDGKEYAVDLHGDLAGILMVASGRNKKFEEGDPVVKQVKAMIEGGNSHFNQDSAQCQGSSENTKSDKMVAGAGFEPTTFGL